MIHAVTWPRWVAAVFSAAMVAACGGGSGAQAPAWSTASVAATLPHGTYPTSIQAEPGGGITVGWTALSQPRRNGWLRQAAPDDPWTSAPELPVEFRDGTRLVGWLTDADGVRAALVHDDGYRTDETGLIDLDPRPAFLQAYERGPGGWTAGPEVFMPPSSNVGGWCSATSTQTGEGFCLVPYRVTVNSEAVAEFRYRPGQGWSGPAVLDAGGGSSSFLSQGRLVSTASGAALALWLWHPHGLSTPGSTGYRVYTPTTGWTGIQPLPGAQPWPGGVSAVAAAHGGYMAAWQQCDALACKIVAADYRNDSWDAPVALTSEIPYTSRFVAGFLVRDPDIRGPAIAAGANGHAVVFWRVEQALRMRHYDPLTGWGAVIDVPDLGEPWSEAATIHVDAFGRVTVVTTKAWGHWTPSSGWSASLPVPWASTSYPKLGLDGRGRIMAVWPVSRMVNGVESTELHTAVLR